MPKQSEAKSAASNAASVLGKRSAQVRLKKWGRKEFLAKMREFGKLGGRPPNAGKIKEKR